MKEQVSTRSVSTEWIMRSPAFERGFDDARNGVAFDWRVGGNDINAQWNYERGRLLAHIAPLDLSLRIGHKLNPKAVALYRAASIRGLIT